MKKHKTPGHCRTNGRKASNTAAKAARKAVKRAARANGIPAGVRLDVTGHGRSMRVIAGSAGGIR